MRLIVSLIIAIFAASCTNPPTTANVEPAQPSAAEQTAPFATDAEAIEINMKKDRVREFFEPMGKPTEYEWLYTKKEAGQTFPEYVNANPTRVTDERKFIYIIPVGTFTPAQEEGIKNVAEYMRAFYGVEVKMLERLTLARVPEARRRINPFDNKPQLQSGWFLEEVLPPRLPKDGAALIALTSADLYPEASWNFVFGQANLQSRVGVYSLARLGNADGNPRERKRFLERALKISMHETGHMFTIQHCTKYVCLMSGSMGLHETDVQPIDVCPECAAKIAWAFHYKPSERYKKLADFCRRVGWAEDAKKFDEKAKKSEN